MMFHKHNQRRLTLRIRIHRHEINHFISMLKANVVPNPKGKDYDYWLMEMHEQLLDSSLVL